MNKMSESKYIIFGISAIILLLSISDVCGNACHQEEQFVKLEGTTLALDKARCI
jgi:uncharacterized membrane protein YuzA (DUF378 family)